MRVLTYKIELLTKHEYIQIANSKKPAITNQSVSLAQVLPFRTTQPE